MQDTLLRVFVVALSLLVCPRDDPGVQEKDDISTVNMQNHEERLLREGDELNHKMAPVSEEMTHTDKRGPQYDVQQNLSNQDVSEKDKMSVLDEVNVTKQDSETNKADHKLPEGGHLVTDLDLNQPQNSKSGSETVSKTSQTAHEKERSDIQTDGSFRDPSRPQRQKEKQEEKEVFSSTDQKSPLTQLHTKTSENETTETTAADWDYFWYIWNAFSIISTVRLFRKYLRRTSQMKQEEIRPFPGTCTAAEVLLPDSNTLQQFHSKCIQVSSDRKWKEDFLEGFASDLLDAMRTVCDKNGSVGIEGFQMMDVCDIIVPLSPPDPYYFQCVLLSNQASDLLADMQVCGQIKLMKNENVQNGCPCQSPDADDMVCLLHCETEKVEMKITDVCDARLCMKNSPFLSKLQVTRWFRSTVKEAWALISHKYEFELNIPYIDAPGALVVRFRTGRKIHFRMNPVVMFNTDSHFFITPCSPSKLDTFWTLSLTQYEDLLLEGLSERLPENSCHSQTLEIALFLHKKQILLSGSTALRDFHFKTALMHLLLAKDQSQWKPNYVACRLRDLLDFMEKSLEKKLLHHVLIGNQTQNVIELPAELTQANRVNLFHPLVVHKCIYRNAVMHFQEMLRNAHMLICDYAEHCISPNNFV